MGSIGKPWKKRRGAERRYRNAIPDRSMAAPRRRLNWRSVGVVVSVAVLLFGLIRLIGYSSASRSRQRTNEELQALHAQGMADPTAAPEEALTAAAEAVPTEAPLALTQTSALSASAGEGAPQPAIPTATPRPMLQGSYQYTSTSDYFLPEMRSLYWKNQDLVAWVNIPGVIDLPVVYRDNNYYLNHDFNGKTSEGGALFMDVLHPFSGRTQHLVVHGHNMQDGTMFGHLLRYTNPSFAREHGSISWSTLFRKETYEVYAVAVVATDEDDARFVDYLGTANFDTENQFYGFLADMQKNSIYWKGVNVSPEDALLTLSTCMDNDRILVLARRSLPTVKASLR